MCIVLLKNDWFGGMMGGGVERWVRVPSELDECSMTPSRRDGCPGVEVRWPVGAASDGITCVTWFGDVAVARAFMMDKIDEFG
jgi:hypothetical protein